MKVSLEKFDSNWEANELIQVYENIRDNYNLKFFKLL